jgi:hypothetical protein
MIKDQTIKEVIKAYLNLCADLYSEQIIIEAIREFLRDKSTISSEILPGLPLDSD